MCHNCFVFLVNIVIFAANLTAKLQLSNKSRKYFLP
nr:MAG TPA: hypothetical protein [Caudoviricetes sp.]